MTRKSFHLAISTVVAVAAIPATTALADKAARGGVTVKNNRGETVRVVIDGELQGMLPSGGRSSFSAPEGRHDLRLEDSDGGLILARRISVERGERARVRLGGADARLVIDNESQVPMTIETVDRKGRSRSMTIAPGDEAEVPVAAGEVAVSAHHAWFNMERRVSVDELRLEPGEVERFVVEPLEEALVRVDNMSDQPIALSIGDAHLGRVGPESVGFVMAPVGGQLIEIATLGLEAGARRVNVSAVTGAKLGFTLRTGEVVLVNRTKTMARASIDGRELGMLRPGQTRVVELPVGSHELAYMAPDGSILQEQTLRVIRDQREYAGFRVQSPAEDVARAERKAGQR